VHDGIAVDVAVVVAAVAAVAVVVRVMPELLAVSVNSDDVRKQLMVTTPAWMCVDRIAV
jgi:hypothetical protein